MRLDACESYQCGARCESRVGHWHLFGNNLGQVTGSCQGLVDVVLLLPSWQEDVQGKRAETYLLISKVVARCEIFKTVKLRMTDLAFQICF